MKAHLDIRALVQLQYNVSSADRRFSFEEFKDLALRIPGLGERCPISILSIIYCDIFCILKYLY